MAVIGAPETGFYGRFAVAFHREWQRLLASPWDLAMVSWVPVLSVALIWWMFSAGLPNQLPMAVLDQDHSSLSRQLVRLLQAAPGLKLVASNGDQAQLAHALRRGDVYAVLAIPADFSRTVKLGQAAQVTLLHNAQLGTHSGLLQRDVRAVVATLSAGVEISARKRRGEADLATLVSMEPLQASTVTLFNTALNYEQFLAAALVPALLHILAMTAGAWAVGRELRDKTIVQWLPAGSSTLQTAAALVGKLALPVLSLSTVGALALGWFTWGRGWQAQGSLVWVVLALVVLVALSVVLGALLAASSQSLRMALSATGFISAPAFAFSGIGFPLLAMPVLARAWAYCLPYTHYIRIQTEQLQMGAPVSYSVISLAWMAAVTLLAGGLCAWSLRRVAAQPDCWGKR